MAKQLFGTDGIRGVAGDPPLDAPTVYAFGLTLGDWARRHGDNPAVLLGMDTRESGPWLAETLAAALSEAGARPVFAGVISTPGVAWLTRTREFVAGVMISASHNPFHDNGLKVFDHSGFKLPDQDEHRLEQEILARRENGVTPRRILLAADEGLDLAYLDSLAATFQGSLAGTRIVLDCAHGAASRLAPSLLARLGAAVTAIGADPDGRNINDGVGALHLHHLAAAVQSSGAHAGFAFDGDADRCLAVSASGKQINGDAILLLCARRLRQTGHLPGDTLIATVMSNLGLEVALRNEGIAMKRTPVGDKYVLEEMVRSGAVLGGEQSGHVIFREWATTGDGMLTALRVLDVMAATGLSLDELTADLKNYPQKLVNVRIRERKPLEQLPAVQEQIRAADQVFDGSGRVLVRFSGTEPLARVMVEGADEALVDAWSARIAQALQAELGAP
ncbi:MAG: phosphoglucosamine mutase [Bryobacter sp.]|jgi:phosphoglucosamine mutase|nr:phosphoglucosamine mutase [Bryobacter sp.]